MKCRGDQPGTSEDAELLGRMEGEMTRITVGGVLFREDRILLGKRSAERNFYPGVWDTPGGHCREGETLEPTLIRELGEELGVVPVEYHRLATVPEPKPEIYDEGFHHIYLVTKWDGMPRSKPVRG